MTVAPALSVVTRPETAGIPYLTVAEFQNAATGVQWQNLIPGGSGTQQTAALQNEILRASSWLDGEAHQVLASTTDTELVEARWRHGRLQIFPRCFPIRAVTALSIGTDPTQLVPFASLTAVIPQSRVFTVWADGPASWTSQGPLQFGRIDAGRCWVEYTYINGYPVSTLSSAVVAGVTSLTPVSVLGILPGMTLTIADSQSTESVVVAASYVLGAATVPLVGPTAYAHLAGVSISALPAVIKKAAALATAGLIRTRGTAALVVSSMGGPTKSVVAEAGGPDDLSLAKSILADGQYIAQVSLPSQL